MLSGYSVLVGNDIEIPINEAIDMLTESQKTLLLEFNDGVWFRNEWLCKGDFMNSTPLHQLENDDDILHLQMLGFITFQSTGGKRSHSEYVITVFGQYAAATIKGDPLPEAQEQWIQNSLKR
jgi:hypothetical protein